jgi:hypothetical protein
MAAAVARSPRRNHGTTTNIKNNMPPTHAVAARM